MRVLHVISSSGMYGAESVILQLLQYGAGRTAGAENALAVFDNRTAPSEEFPEAAMRAGVAVHRVVCRGQADRAVPKQLVRLARELGADVVHAHGYKADLYCWTAFRGFRSRPSTGRVVLVSTCHGWIDNGLKVQIYGALDRAVLRGFDRVLAVSHEVRGRLLRAGVRQDRVVLVVNGIDAAPFAALLPGMGQGKLVGLVGRLAPEKGVDVFLRAAAQVRERVGGARFVVWGEGPERAMLEGLRRELGLDGVVSMPGRRNDMVSALGELDVMVSASRQEGLPMVLLEGMASGRAMVATAVGEVPGVLEDGRTGVLVPREAAEELAAAILELLEKPARRQAMGAAAREEVRQRFSVEAMAEAYEEVYRAELKGRGHGTEA